MRNFKYRPTRDAKENYFTLPNEIFSLGLSSNEIALYSYLLYRENRETYQCYPSYRTIGKALLMSNNTVRKYVRLLEKKGFISTESTTIRRSNGRKFNGNLRYTIRPIDDVIKSDFEDKLQRARIDKRNFGA